MRERTEKAASDEASTSALTTAAAEAAAAHAASANAQVVEARARERGHGQLGRARMEQPAQEDGLGVFGAERELARAVVELEHAREHAVGAERAVGREVRDELRRVAAVEARVGRLERKVTALCR